MNVSEEDKVTAARSDLAAILAASGNERKKSRRRGRLVVLAVVLLALGAGAYFYAGRERAGYDYTTAPIKRGDMTVLVTATGAIQPTEQVDISSELSGTVRDVNVDYNSPVKAGDVLAVLDTNNLEANVKSSQAKLNSAKANVVKAIAQMQQAQVALDRLRNLVKSNVSTQQSLDDAQYTYDSAAATKQINEADVLAAEADLRLAQVNLAKAKIVSPIEGMVLTRSVNPGATVAASLSAPILFTIAGDLRKMELRVDVDEADVGRITIGQKANFTVEAYPDQKFPAEIKQIRYASDTTNNVVTYKAVLSVDNPEMLLRPGMTATADVVTQSLKDAVLIPNAALRYVPPVASDRSPNLMSLFRPPRIRSGGNQQPALTGNNRRVWVMREGQPSAVTIQVGASDGQFTQVLSNNISDKDVVVTDSMERKR